MKRIIGYILKMTGWEKLGVLYGYLRNSGWFLSVRTNKSVDTDGNVLPWYSYPFIHFVERQINALSNAGGKLRVFEFGSGHSTLWWAKRAKQIVSVEDNKVWYEYVSKQKPDNVHYKFAPDEEQYVNALIEEPENFDVIIIDGSYRAASVRKAIEKVTPDGVLIIENSDWESIADSISFLKDRGFRQLEFYGLGPLNGHPWGTSILYRDHNVLNI